MAKPARTGVTSYTTPSDREVLILRVVDAPRRVVFDAWTQPQHVRKQWGPDWPETINTPGLTESGGQTNMALTVTYPSKAARDAALKTGMKDGMDVSYARLDQLLKELA